MGTTSKLCITPVGNGFAAEVTGVDLRQLTDAEFSQIHETYAAAEVLFFRDQDLSPTDQVAFAERFGEINVNRFFQPVAGHPQVAQVLKEPEQTANIGGGWHTDHSYDEIPAMGSMLYALEVPERGGDTLFASMTCAYAALSPGLQETLRGLAAVHSSRHVFGAQGPANTGSDGRISNAHLAEQDAVHPVVVQHPLSKKPTLYVNPGFTLRIDGWTAEESAPLLNYLYQQAVRPEFVYRHQWRPGTMAFWDNRAAWHYALNDYQGQRRLMHRITLDGVGLAAA